MRPSRIAVDWDSTLCEEVWPEMGDWLPGAKDALYTLAHMYDEVVIHTLRVSPVEIDEVRPRNPSDQFAAIQQKLAEARMPTNVWVWDRPYKPPCEFFVDDRAIRFEGDWDAVLAKIAVERATNRKEDQMDKKLCAPSIHQGDPGDEQPFEHESPYQKAKRDFLESTTTTSWQVTAPAPGVLRTFETGATRNVEVDPDYHGFLSPLAVHAYGEYMHTHRLQADGSLRDSDNWQKGMPADAYVRSLVRHTHDVQLIHDGYEALARGDDRDPDKLKAHLAAIIFNAQGLLHELVKAEQLEAA